jgi:hypothetical protein
MQRLVCRADPSTQRQKRPYATKAPLHVVTLPRKLPTSSCSTLDHRLTSAASSTASFAPLAEPESPAVQRLRNLLQMLGVVPHHLVELVLQSPDARFAVDPLEMPLGVI